MKGSIKNRTLALPESDYQRLIGKGFIGLAIVGGVKNPHRRRHMDLSAGAGAVNNNPIGQIKIYLDLRFADNRS